MNAMTFMGKMLKSYFLCFTIMHVYPIKSKENILTFVTKVENFKQHEYFVTDCKLEGDVTNLCL